jgi:hypothetical protein
MIVSHLGINPVSGGRPPKESKVRLNIIDMFKEFISIWGICENDSDFHVLSMINIGVIMAEYRMKYVTGISVILVVNLPMIHPM